MPLPADNPRDLRRAMPWLVVVASSVVCVAFVVVLVSGWASASARISASTNNESNLFSAGTIDLQVGIGARFQLNEPNLYPGREISRCVPLTYEGTIENAQTRLLAELVGGTGLEAFLLLDVAAGAGTNGDCSDFIENRQLFTGGLDQLQQNHRDYATGVAVWNNPRPGGSTTLRFDLQVIDDNDAQARETDFWLTIEARP